MSRAEDLAYMEQACRLALNGEGRVEPNPMVGCVLVRDGQVIATGFHQQFGGPHAEREALSQLSDGKAAGATAYVTLEPCCHHGKTPPCTDALIAAGISRVCCATLDPFPQVSGRGVEQLRAAGIVVDVLDPPESTARDVLAPYWKRVTTGLPYLIAKWAMSLDGKLATRTGDSRWISSPTSREHAHRTRGRMDAVIVGSQTAIIDDPLLTARPAGPRTQVRVVVDSHARLPLNSQLVKTAGQSPVLVWAGQSAAPDKLAQLRDAGCQVVVCEDNGTDRLLQLLRYLADHYRATNVLCEGGGTLLGKLVDASTNFVDEFHVYIAPKIIGGAGAVGPCLGEGFTNVADGPSLRVRERLTLDQDQFLRLSRK